MLNPLDELIEGLQPKVIKATTEDGYLEEVITAGRDVLLPTEERELLKYLGHDPDKRRIRNGNRQTAWYKDDGISLMISTEDIPVEEQVLDYDSIKEFWREVRKPNKDSFSKRREGRFAVVVATSDEQFGKVDRTGGTPETLARTNKILTQLILPYVEELKPDLIVAPHGGDLVEGFNNTSAQRATNDLSDAKQFEVGMLYRSTWIEALGRHAPLLMGSVTSNHAQDKIDKGKPAGNAEDDKGLVIERLVYERAKAIGYDVRLLLPENQFFEWNIFPIFGWKMGLIHGHQVRGGAVGVKPYMLKHEANGSSLSHADFMVVAHNHEEYVMQYGRSKSTGRARQAIGLPPLDNGSAWFTNLTAADSDPGVTTFIIHEDTGLDLTSIKRWHLPEDTQRAVNPGAHFFE